MTGKGLQLLVDGAVYEALPNSGWNTRSIIVPRGQHRYGWSVTAEKPNERPYFVLDAIKCTDLPPQENNTGTWGFDEGFVPSEFKGFDGDPSSRWQMTDAAAMGQGFGVRPGTLKQAVSSELSMDCAGKEHSAIKFSYAGSAELIVDDAVYEKLPNSGWNTRQFALGTHRYGWRVTAKEAGQPYFFLDSVICVP